MFLCKVNKNKNISQKKSYFFGLMTKNKVISKKLKGFIIRASSLLGTYMIDGIDLKLRSPLSTLPLPPRPRRLLRHDLRIDLLLRENSESSASRFRHTRGDYSVRLERRQRRDSRPAHGSPSHRRHTNGCIQINLTFTASLPLVVKVKILAASATSSGNGGSVAIRDRRTDRRRVVDSPLFAFARHRGDFFLPSELLVEGAGYLLVARQFIALRRYVGHGDRLLLLC